MTDVVLGSGCLRRDSEDTGEPRVPKAPDLDLSSLLLFCCLLGWLDSVAKGVASTLFARSFGLARRLHRLHQESPPPPPPQLGNAPSVLNMVAARLCLRISISI